MKELIAPLNELNLSETPSYQPLTITELPDDIDQAKKLVMEFLRYHFVEDKELNDYLLHQALLTGFVGDAIRTKTGINVETAHKIFSRLTKNPAKTSPSSPLPQDVIEAFWKEDGVDMGVVDKLHDYLANCAATEAYSHNVFITGPSGIGKSFAVSRLTKRDVYVFYLTFKNDTGYPFPVWKTELKLNTEEDLKILIVVAMEVILGAVIHKISPFDLLKLLIPKSVDAATAPDSTGTKLYRWIESRMKSLLEIKEMVLLEMMTKIATYLNLDNLPLEYDVDNKISMVFNQNRSQLASVEPVYKFLLEHARVPDKDCYPAYSYDFQLKPTRKLSFVIAFDEVYRGKDENIVDIRNLRHALRHIPFGKRCIATLCDTVSDAMVYAPPVRYERSGRLPTRSQHIHHPYYFLTPRDFEIEDGQLNDILDPSIQNKIGRWMWSSYGNQGHLIDGVAQSKLVKRNKESSIDRESALAIFGVRIPIPVKNSNIAADLTASHMRYVHHISKDRNVYLGGYTMEPVLARAAKSFMGKESQQMITILEHLRELILAKKENMLRPLLFCEHWI